MSDRSLLKNNNAHEMSHACFSQGISSFSGSITSTHPPLKERIRRIEPRWDGNFVQTKSSGIENAIKSDKKTDSRKEKTSISLTKFDSSPDHLLLLKPLLKESLLKACLASTMTDNKITTREPELILAIADTLNCHIPPVEAT